MRERTIKMYDETVTSLKTLCISNGGDYGVDYLEVNVTLASGAFSVFLTDGFSYLGGMHFPETYSELKNVINYLLEQKKIKTALKNFLDRFINDYDLLFEKDLIRIKAIVCRETGYREDVQFSMTSLLNYIEGKKSYIDHINNIDCDSSIIYGLQESIFDFLE